MFILGWWVLQCALSAVSAPGSGLCIAAVLAVLPDITLVAAMINVLHHSDSAYRVSSKTVVKLRRGSGKDRQGMAPKAKGLKASTLA